MADLIYMAKTKWTALLDSIRAKGGTSALMTADQAKAAVDAIPTGGGEDTIEKLFDGTLGDYTYDGNNRVKDSTFKSAKGIRDMRFPNTTMIEQGAFSYSEIRSVFAPKATISDSAFRGCANLKTVVTKAAYAGSSHFRKYNSAMSLTIVDFTAKGNAGIAGSMFDGCDGLTTLILRESVIYPVNINAFNNTRFTSGGSGGTIYIPKALYDHIGDGTALDYKAATNWSVLDGYGTITWAQIEGSIYENAYADGTPIS